MNEDQAERPKRLPGEHHVHDLHLYADPKERKKALARLKAQTVCPLPDLDERVVISVSGPETDCLIGTVRYAGKVVFAGGDWVGIELDQPHGKNSGAVWGCSYFTCDENHGLFVQPNKIIATGERVAPFVEEERIRLKKARKSMRDKSKTVAYGEEVDSFHAIFESLPEIGMRVAGKVDGKRYPGEVRFVGSTKFAGGHWVGLHLDNPVGKNNGTVNGVKYFECPENQGLFIRPDACIIPQKSTPQPAKIDELGDPDTIAEEDVDVMSADVLRLMVAKLRKDKDALQVEITRLNGENEDLTSAYEVKFFKDRESVEDGEETYSRQEAAAVKLQSMGRGRKARKEFAARKKENASALKIQRTHRGNKARRKAKQKRAEQRFVAEDDQDDGAREDEEQQRERAVVKIQAAQRGKAGRRRSAEVASERETFDVVVSFTVENVAYEALIANSKLFEAVRIGVQEQIAQEAGAWTLPKHVQVELSPGSVIARATIMSISEELQVAIKQTLMASANLAQNITSLISRLPGIEAVASDVILVRALKVESGEDLQSRAAELLGDAALSGDLDRVLQDFVAEEGPDLTPAEDSSARDITLEGDTLANTRSPRATTRSDVSVRTGSPRATARSDVSVRTGSPRATTRSDVSVPSQQRDQTNSEIPSEVVETPSLVSRIEKLKALFSHLDTKQTGRWTSRELFTYAQELGFPGGTDEFAEEWVGLCEMYKIDRAVGLDVALFVTVANEEEGDYNCEDWQLDALLQKFDGASDPAMPPDESFELEATVKPVSRAALLETLFKALDVKGSSKLFCEEMFVYARLCGFPGSLKEFGEEYENLCGDVKCSPADGIDAKRFASIVDDTESDYFFDVKDEDVRDRAANLSPQLKAVIEGQPLQATSTPVGSARSGTESGEGGAALLMPQGQEKPLGRMEGVAALFSALDQNQNNRLTSSEMYEFAKILGFEGSAEEFAKEYEDTCKSLTCDVKAGLSQEMFQKLVDDREGDWYVEDEQLQIFINDVEEKVAADLPPVHRSPPAPSPRSTDSRSADSMETEERSLSPPKTRAELVKAVFALLDTHSTGQLLHNEMYHYAQAIGFPGDLKEFEEEFQALCNDAGCTTKSGLDENNFSKLVNDEDTDYYIVDAQLGKVIEDLTAKKQPPRPSIASVNLAGGAKAEATGEKSKIPARTDRIKALFRALNTKQNGRLVSPELFVYASMIGFPGDAQDFEGEFEEICKDQTCDGKVGLDEKAFDQLISADQESDYFCTDDNLETLLQEIEKSSSTVTPPGQPAVGGSTAPAQPTPDAFLDAPTSGVPPPKTRVEFAAALFKAADRDGNARLNSSEMFKVAQVMGFPETEEEFAGEWEGLCEDYKVDGRHGVDAATFAKMLADEEGSYYIEHDQLAPSLKQLEDISRKAPLAKTENNMAVSAAAMADAKPPATTAAPAAPATANAAPAEAEKGVKSRTDLVKALFRALDKKENGRLLGSELLVYARELGFPGDAQEFDEEYTEICKEQRVDVKTGLDEKAFDQLVSADQESDYYCPDDQLKDFTQKLQSSTNIAVAENETPGQPALVANAALAEGSSRPQSRAEYGALLYKTADRDGDGWLNFLEMFRVAQVIGYEDTEKEFAEEWDAICEDYKVDAKRGVDQKTFAYMISHEEGNYYIEDDQLAVSLKELEELLRKVPPQQKPQEPALASVPAQAQAEKSEAGFATKSEPKGRTDMVKAVFDCLDNSRRGRLLVNEIYRYAVAVGYEDDIKEFHQEYIDLCKDMKSDPQKGLEEDAFLKLISDTDSEYYADDQQLPDILTDLASKPVPKEVAAPFVEAPTQPKTRVEYVSAIFEAADRNKDGRLDQAEMFRVAQVMGFEDGMAEFKEEWDSLCNDEDINPKEGVDAKKIEQLTSDKDGSYYIEDADLEGTLKEMRAAK